MNGRGFVLIAAIGILAVIIILQAGIPYLIGFFAALALIRLVALHFIWNYTAPIPPAPKGTIKIACIGDSITYGSKVMNRAQNCYPAQLEALLGKRYAVRNFGVNGRTMLKSADRPYWKHRNFRRSSEFEPDIVLIMLGTNDSKQKNWTTSDEFIKDYRQMIHHYRNLPPHPTIYLMTPPMAHRVEGMSSINYTISNGTMDGMSLAIRKLAEEEKLDVIDIRAATAHHPEVFPLDGIHTNVAGATLIAQTVFQVLTNRH